MGVSSSTPDDKPTEEVIVVLNEDENDDDYIDEDENNTDEINELTTTTNTDISKPIKKRGRKKKDATNTETTTTSSSSSSTTTTTTTNKSLNNSTTTINEVTNTEPQKGFRLDASALIEPDRLSEWLSTPVNDDLCIIPGIGEATANILIKAGYTTPYKLIGKYLSFRSDGINTQEHCDMFYHFLGDLGVRGAYRAVITRAIAEKMNLLIPGIFREDELRR